MKDSHIDVDYLVIGTGATAMAFVDTLLTETEARVAMVDRHHRPGGHWNEAYPFVRLHQSPAYYGVASRELAVWTKEQAGLNEGMYGLSSGAEVLAYFDGVMQQRFLPSGRVTWLPMSDYTRTPAGEHQATSLTTGASTVISVQNKVVDATLAHVNVPAMRGPRYALDPGVKCVPPNDLPKITRPYSNYTVVGSGKTGMDACIWLMENGVEPDRIRWIMPRDAWTMDRINTQPGLENFERTVGATIAQFDAIIDSTSVADLFARLESGGLLRRVDPRVEPSTYRCAILSSAELEALRRIGDVVRMGHVQGIEASRLILDHGDVPAVEDTLYVDCTAGAISQYPDLPVFTDDRINLQTLRWCQPLFSAALTAFVESAVPDLVEKNALCSPVKLPEYPLDWLVMWESTLANMARWGQHAQVTTWLRQCRLYALTVVMRGVETSDAPKMALLAQSAAKAPLAAQRLRALLSENQ
jgi:hypothetical protein